MSLCPRRSEIWDRMNASSLSGFQTRLRHLTALYTRTLKNQEGFSLLIASTLELLEDTDFPGIASH